MRKGVFALAAAGLIATSCSGGDAKRSASESGSTTRSTSGETSTGGETATGGAPTTHTQTGTTPGTTGSTTTAPGGPPPPPPPSGPGPPAPPARPFLVGSVDDAFLQRFPGIASRLVGVARAAGFNAVLVSARWRRGLTKPDRLTVIALRNVVRSARNHHARPFLLVWNGFQNNTPVTRRQREKFAAFAAAVVRRAPGFEDVVVGNEPNLNTFWMPQFGPKGRDVAAEGYFDLLARTYDALKEVSPRIRVIGGALAARGVDRPGTGRDTHSPGRFLHDLGAQFRAQDRSRPIMDAFSIHPYPGHSRIPPDVTHPGSKTITLGDYPRLVRVLDAAFDGTPQRGSSLPIFYTEYGVETVVPAAKRRFYTNFDAPDAPDVVSPALQARYYRRAFAAAYCQPRVKGFFIFHTFDERDLEGWQSGLYYADQTRKPSLGSFRRTAAAVHRGSIARCAG